MDQTRGENELCLLHLSSSHKHHREESLLSACRREEARASQSAIVPSAPRRTPPTEAPKETGAAYVPVNTTDNALFMDGEILRSFIMKLEHIRYF